MEDVLEIYHMPYDPDYPVVCMDESSKQMVGEVHEPIPCKPGQPKRMDDEYVRKGVAEIFMEVEPLAGKRHVAVTERRTRKDWAQQIKQMLDERYPDAVQVRLIMDNLNTHNIASLYETFEPQEARRLAERLEIHHTPKHGSWLNMAEIELRDERIEGLNKALAKANARARFGLGSGKGASGLATRAPYQSMAASVHSVSCSKEVIPML